MAKTLVAKLLTRNDTAANWTSANPVLSKGEIGIETDTNKFKFGDGVTAWNALNYAGVSISDVPLATASIDGLMSKGDYSKLVAIEAQAQVNIIESIKVNNVALSITSKGVNIVVPTGALASKDKVAQTDFDTALTTAFSALITSTEADTKISTALGSYYTKTEVDGKVTSVFKWKGTKATVGDLPSSDNVVGDVWHVTADNGEYAWNGTAWELLGGTIDLSQFANKNHAHKFIDLTDVPDNYIADKFVKVNAYGTALEYGDGGGGGISEIPQATETVLGGIKAAEKTSGETQEVKIDTATGKLYSTPPSAAQNGVAAGGTTGQIYSKNSNNDYDGKWVNVPAAANGVPSGGEDGQVLYKVGTNDFEAQWGRLPKLFIYGDTPSVDGVDRTNTSNASYASMTAIINVIQPFKISKIYWDIYGAGLYTMKIDDVQRVIVNVASGSQDDVVFVLNEEILLDKGQHRINLDISPNSRIFYKSGTGYIFPNYITLTSETNGSNNNITMPMKIEAYTYEYNPVYL